MVIIDRLFDPLQVLMVGLHPSAMSENEAFYGWIVYLLILLESRIFHHCRLCNCMSLL